MKTLNSLFLAKTLNKSRLLLLSIIALNLTACWDVTVVKPPVETKQQDKDKAEDNKKSIFNKRMETIKDTPESKKNVVERLFSKKQEDDEEQQNKQSELLPVNSNLGSIDYGIDSWSKLEVKPLDMAEVTANPEFIAPVVSIDENSLDFASHKATKYRFMENNSPYFDMVNSRDYLEIGWHFANINDSDEVKQTSVHHAKKAYKLARQLMRIEGGQVVVDMLAGHVIKDKAINGIYIAIAKCEFYSCMLVIEKNKVIQEDNTTAEDEKEEVTKNEEKEETEKLSDE